MPFYLISRHVLKTNFYKVDKVAVSFRLDASFLDDKEYPTKPYGIFYVIGDEFRGFHVRFADVARGIFLHFPLYTTLASSLSWFLFHRWYSYYQIKRC